MTRGWKIGLGVVAALVALNVGFSVLRSVTGGSPGGPALSSYATGATGVGAWADLLSRSGYSVRRLDVRPSQADLQPSSTVVLLDPPFVLKDDATALQRFVAAGGRLVAGGGDVTWLRTFVPGGLTVGDTSVPDPRPLAPVPEVSGVRHVVTADEGSWDDVHGGLPILGDSQSSVATLVSDGAGSAVLLADPSSLENGYLGAADNARFAVDVVGPRSRQVEFLETYHGYGAAGASGLGAIPGNWQAMLAFEALAVLVFLLAKSRRLGPPERASREPAPSRREYVEALAVTLARTRKPALALARVTSEVRAAIVRDAGLQPGAPLEQINAAALRLGLTPEEAAAAAGAPERSQDVLALGRALARLRDRHRRGAWQV